jgi:hypothetical protein
VYFDRAEDAGEVHDAIARRAQASVRVDMEWVKT